MLNKLSLKIWPKSETAITDSKVISLYFVFLYFVSDSKNIKTYGITPYTHRSAASSFAKEYTPSPSSRFPVYRNVKSNTNKLTHKQTSKIDKLSGLITLILIKTKVQKVRVK